MHPTSPPSLSQHLSIRSCSSHLDSPVLRLDSRELAEDAHFANLAPSISPQHQKMVLEAVPLSPTAARVASPFGPQPYFTAYSASACGELEAFEEQERQAIDRYEELLSAMASEESLTLSSEPSIMRTNSATTHSTGTPLRNAHSLCHTPTAVDTQSGCKQRLPHYMPQHDAGIFFAMASNQHCSAGGQCKPCVTLKRPLIGTRAHFARAWQRKGRKQGATQKAAHFLLRGKLLAWLGC
jgi:hypothetical protein